MKPNISEHEAERYIKIICERERRIAELRDAVQGYEEMMCLFSGITLTLINVIGDAGVETVPWSFKGRIKKRYDVSVRDKVLYLTRAGRKSVVKGAKKAAVGGEKGKKAEKPDEVESAENNESVGRADKKCEACKTGEANKIGFANKTGFADNVGFADKTGLSGLEKAVRRKSDKTGKSAFKDLGLMKLAQAMKSNLLGADSDKSGSVGA